jgi:hypothetical protein
MIGDLWQSRDQLEWCTALDAYWTIPSVKKNRAVEEELDGLDPNEIKAFDAREWYDFLKNKYYPWKFAEYLSLRLLDLRRYEQENRLGELLSIKQSLFTIDLTNIREGLVTAKRIHGLGWIAASGLLAVLFPASFGTVDQMVIKALCEIKSLPERDEVLEMKARLDAELELKRSHAELLIEIMRRKATELNNAFGTHDWTPRKIDKILWASRNTNPNDQCVLVNA